MRILLLALCVLFISCGYQDHDGPIVIVPTPEPEDPCDMVKLAWNPVTTNEDGTPTDDLAGYIIYYGTISGNYASSKDVGNITRGSVHELKRQNTYYFAVTAYDLAGNESKYSKEISKLICGS